MTQKYQKVYITKNKENLDNPWKLTYSNANSGKKITKDFPSQESAVTFYKNNFSNSIARIHGKDAKFKFSIIINGDKGIQYKYASSVGLEEKQLFEKENVTTIVNINSDEKPSDISKNETKKINYFLVTLAYIVALAMIIVGIVLITS